jgi:hypothetical protein
VDAWELCFGEGFHSFVASVSEADAVAVEAEWTALNVPFRRIGAVVASDRLEVLTSTGRSFGAGVKQLRMAWQKGGYWE